MSEPADFLKKLAQSDRKAAERLRKAEIAAKGHSTRLATVWADDIELQLDDPGLVDGLLSSTGMTVMYGESGAGKTFVGIDLACHVGAGKPWRGMPVEQGVVVYIAAESPESVQRRIWAWKQRHDVKHLPVLVITSNVDLLNGDAAELVALVRQIRESRGRVCLTVVDTLARAMTGNENAPEDMGKFVAACADIREASEGHVLVIHHCGKDIAKGARGHSSLRAATDVELEVTNGEAGGCIRVTKHRDEAGGTTYGFKLETVELGTNSKGRVVTTCVTAETEAPESAAREAPARPRRLTDKGKLLVQAVEKALKYAAERPPYHDETRGVTDAVTVTVARSYWRQLIGWEEASEREKERSRQDWKRGLENALAADAVRRWGDYLWLPMAFRPVTRDRDSVTPSKEGVSRHVTVPREATGGVTGVTAVTGVTVCHGRHGADEDPEDGPDEVIEAAAERPAGVEARP